MFFVHRSRGHDGTCVWRSWQRCFPANLVKFIQAWKPNFNFIFQSFQGFSRVILWIFMGLCHENCRIFQDILTKLGFPRNLHQKILNWWQKKIPSAWDILRHTPLHSTAYLSGDFSWRRWRSCAKNSPTCFLNFKIFAEFKLDFICSISCFVVNPLSTLSGFFYILIQWI